MPQKPRNPNSLERHLALTHEESKNLLGRQGIKLVRIIKADQAPDLLERPCFYGDVALIKFFFEVVEDLFKGVILHCAVNCWSPDFPSLVSDVSRLSHIDLVFAQG